MTSSPLRHGNSEQYDVDARKEKKNLESEKWGGEGGVRKTLDLS